MKAYVMVGLDLELTVYSLKKSTDSNATGFCGPSTTLLP